MRTLCYKLVILFFCTLGSSHWASLSLLARTDYNPMLVKDGVIWANNWITITYPYGFWLLYAKYHTLAPSLFKIPLLIALSGIFLSFVILYVWSLQVSQQNLTSSGSSHWATFKEMKEAGILQRAGEQGSGVICGTVYAGLFPYEGLFNVVKTVCSWCYRKDKATDKALSIMETLESFYFITRRYYIVDNMPSHGIMIAPSRSGKGIGVVVPTLLNWQDSCIVADIKRELLQDTGSYRQHILGQNVIEFAPTDASPTYRFNPLNEIRWATANEEKDVTNLLNSIVGKGEGKDKHWIDNAKDILTGVIIHLKYAHALYNERHGLSPYDEEYVETSMYHVYEYMTNSTTPLGSPCSFKEKLTNLLQEENREDLYHFPCTLWLYNVSTDLPKLQIRVDEKKAQEITTFSIEAKKTPRLHPVVISKFNAFIGKPDNEGGSVLSTAITAISIFSEKLVADNTKVSDFVLGDLRYKEKPTTLYLFMPPSDMKRAGGIFRFMIEFITDRGTEEIKKTKGLHRVLFLVDEFPAFGNMSDFIRAIGEIAGYGFKSLLIIQSLEQITATYKTTEVLGNCEVQIYLAPRDKETPKVLSDKLGQQTIIVKQKSKKVSFFDTPSVTYIEKGRSLMTVDETMATPDSIVLYQGLKIKSPKNKFFINPDLMAKLKAGKEADPYFVTGYPPAVAERILTIRAGKEKSSLPERTSIHE